VTRYHDLLRGPGNRSAWLARLAQTVVDDPAPVLRRIDAPTLLLWGQKDRFIPVANAARFAQALPHAELATFAALGHVPHEEAPALSLTPVRAFLARAPDATGAGSRDAR
jgi:pimeloyl-ACP methyl ester carboxylesterase